MSYQNIYYSPEAFGLTTVGEVEWREPCYDFDLTAVWWNGTELLWASDSGCSCPSPFEDFNIGNVERGSLSELSTHLQEHIAGKHGWHGLSDNPSAKRRAEAQVVDLLARAIEVAR